MAKTTHQRWPIKALWALEESDDLAVDTSDQLNNAVTKLEKAISLIRSNPDAAELLIAYALRHITEGRANQEQIRRVLAQVRHGREAPGETTED
jgi:hypothetical protein